ncbi:hypothetical protein C8R44DRAFT_882041 [Mycena epipterygia]|nr:hypothetical protein C8R44DRAFT_882041 [Mycena epipterygia]
MGPWLALVLPLLLCGLPVHAGDPNVSPQEAIVPQCFHADGYMVSDSSPRKTAAFYNLVDLGIQNGTFTTFQVGLPIGQNFSFAYNTLADQFTVFTSSVMQVGSGTTDCLPQSPPITSKPSSSPSSSSPVADPSTPPSTPSSTPQSTSVAILPGSSKPATGGSNTASSASSASSSAPQSAFTAVAQNSAAASTTSGSSKSAFPVGAIVGIVCVVAAVIIIALLLFWNSHRRSMKLLAELRSDPERTAAPKLSAPIIRRGPSDPITPYQENATPRPTSTNKSFFTGMQMRERESETVSSSGSRDTANMVVPPQDVIVEPPKTRRLALRSPVTPTTAPLSPRVHTDAGVRIRDPEELPPMYHDYNNS